MTRATIIWFVGAAVVGAAAGGLHLLRSQSGGAHTGVPLAVGAFGLTALAAVMLFQGVMTAAREQDALAAPEPAAQDERVDDVGEQQPAAVEPGETDEHVAGEPESEKPESEEPESEEPAAVPERQAVPTSGEHTAYDPVATDDLVATDEPVARDEGPEVYTFRRGKPVRERAGRDDRPPRRDRPA